MQEKEKGAGSKEKGKGSRKKMKREQEGKNQREQGERKKEKGAEKNGGGSKRAKTKGSREKGGKNQREQGDRTPPNRASVLYSEVLAKIVLYLPKSLRCPLLRSYFPCLISTKVLLATPAFPLPFLKFGKFELYTDTRFPN